MIFTFLLDKRPNPFNVICAVVGDDARDLNLSSSASLEDGRSSINVKDRACFRRAKDQANLVARLYVASGDQNII